ncbi:hypothetical protein F2Q69_00019217 [Brassica cretica]|uniref:Uncharacterized protein n=1 Tax=Brassica cretica TaxID=69181 RepID=A0A8S9QNW4_BRACR|nr:hypothetical protein F2Q69_00019217 [Brassica cretica]
MFNLRSITVDVPSKQAWVQAGATLGELYTKISEAGETLAFPAGVCSTKKQRLRKHDSDIVA